MVGYSRAVRVGNHIHVAGTTASDENGNVVGDTVYDQARFIFKKIETALLEADASMDDVVRTRMYVRDMAEWEQAAKAHGAVFTNIRPASTMVEVSRLVDDDMLIEIEVDAVIGVDRYIDLFKRLLRKAYWPLILLLWVSVAINYARHLATGATPDSVALSLLAGNFNVYWYGLIIVAGILLGAWVAADLAGSLGRAAFDRNVSAEVQAQPLTNFPIRRFKTVGQLLYEWGNQPKQFPISAEDNATWRHRLSEESYVPISWFDNAPWRTQQPQHIWNGLLWALSFGFIGARLYHIFAPAPSMRAIGIESSSDYFRNLIELVSVRNGGMGILGGIIGGAIGLWIYTRRQDIPWLALTDIAVVGLALGQWLGRWGNFVNQELYGRQTFKWWGVYIDQPLLNLGPDARFHPLFLYESLWCFIAFWVLWRLLRAERLPMGAATGLYLVWYGIGRIAFETIRVDTRLIGTSSIPVASAVCVVFIAAGAYLLVRSLRGRVVAQPSG